MAKKKKISNELPSINFKLSKELKQWITEEAYDENLTISNFLRKELTATMNGDSITVDKKGYYGYKLVGSPKFLNLMVWMYSKKNDKNCKIDNQKLGVYINTLKEIINIFPEVVESEFEKVLLDTLKVKSKKSDYERTFKFSRDHTSLNNHNTVNFAVIEHHLLVERDKIIIRELL